jgi:hypothetical protein
MSNKRSDQVSLDRSYGDGKLAGFWGLATSAGCPFGRDQVGPRIAWLDGFAYGAWKRSAKIKASTDRRVRWPGLESSDQPDLDNVNITISQRDAEIMPEPIRGLDDIGPGRRRCPQVGQN